MSLLNVRPAPATQANPFVVNLAAQVLITHSLKQGDIVLIETPDGNRREVQVARSADKNMNASVIQMSAQVQKLYSLGTQQKVKLIPKQIEVPDCRNVVLHETLLEPDVKVDDHASSRNDWTDVVEKELRSLELISAGLELSRISGPGGLERSFKIAQVDNTAGIRLFNLASKTSVKVMKFEDLNKPLRLGDARKAVCGLDRTIQQLQNRLSWYGDANDGSRRRQGILIHGPAGTGKSMLIDCVLEANWLAKFKLDSSATKATIEHTVEDALKCQPAVIAIHDLAEIAAANSPNHPSPLSVSLRRAIERVAGAQVLVIAACHSLLDIDQRLRNVEYFSSQYELRTPNTATRAEILKVSRGVAHKQPNDLLDFISTLTHGYVGRDLVHLIKQAEEMAEERTQGSDTSDLNGSLIEATFDIQLIEDDFLEALKLIKPSALREIVIETPSVHWKDVAGQDEAKQLLEKAITWPLKHAHILKKHNRQAARGMLLYGPPGCSKTMMAKAIATESKLNFISVKGAQLLNMYVGESERAIRDIFAKAAAASPCILFFDEFEAVAASRLHTTGSSSPVHTVTTLLTEMDGFGARRDIFVLCATNFPEQIDAAVMRPGRIDKILYIGPPDLAARTQIIKQQCSKMQIGDVNFDEIAVSADGMSGAEIVELCHSACDIIIADEIRTGEDQYLHTSHLQRALPGIRKSITADVLGRYEDFDVSHR